MLQHKCDNFAGVDDSQHHARRQAFMKLLREGVQEKVQKGSTCSTSWHALAWRNAFALNPYFVETVNGQSLRIRQLLQGEVTGFGTGLTVWPAAVVLLKHLEYRFGSMSPSHASLKGQLVVELGSGTGAVGITAAILGAERVVLTDIPKLLGFLQTNVDLVQQITNGHMGMIDVEPYMWGSEPTDRLLSHSQTKPDLIIVSDCILPKLYPIEPLVDALVKLSDCHTRILISYEHRYYEPFDPKLKFKELLIAHNFDLHDIAKELYHPQYYAPDIEIWEATIKR